MSANVRPIRRPAGLGAFGILRTLGSALVSRANLARIAGLTFGGKRDLYEALGYPRDLTPDDFYERYRRNAIARRIVCALPNATWRGGIELVEDEDPKTWTAFEEAWNDLQKRLKVWNVLHRADILAGLGEFSGVLVGAPGRLVEPLPDRLTPEQIAYLQPFSQRALDVKATVADPADSRFGLPLTYELRQGGLPAREVHFSRVLHVAENLLEDEVRGEPRLECVWNLLDDLEKTTGGGAEAFWLRVHQGFHLDVDPEAELEPEDETALSDEVEEYVHGMRRFIRTQGAKLNVLGSDVASFDSNISAILDQISGGTGIPKRILIGSERGELASTQDRENWRDRVQDRRDQFGEPLVRTLADLLLKHGVLPEPEEYNVRWPGARDMGDNERAELGQKWAAINQAAGETVVTPDEIRDRILGLESLAELEGYDADETVDEDAETAVGVEDEEEEEDEDEESE